METLCSALSPVSTWRPTVSPFSLLLSPGMGRGGHWLFELGYQLPNYSPPPPPHTLFGQRTAPVLLPPNLQPPVFMGVQGQPLEINIKWWMGGGGEWRTDSLSLGNNCQTTAPHFLDKGQPLFCYLQIYSPLFSWMSKDSPLKSTLSFLYLILIFYLAIVSKGLKNKLNACNSYLIWNISWWTDSDSSPIVQYNIRTAPPPFLAAVGHDSHRSPVVGPQSVPFYRLSTLSPLGSCPLSVSPNRPGHQHSIIGAWLGWLSRLR